MYPRNHKKWEPLWETVHLRERFDSEIEKFGILTERSWENRMEEFLRKSRKVETSLFFGQICAHFGCVAHIPVIRCWCPSTRRDLLGVEYLYNVFLKIVWRVSETIDTFIKMSREKNNSQNFFRLPKIEKLQNWLCYFHSHFFQQTGSGSNGPFPAR